MKRQRPLLYHVMMVLTLPSTGQCFATTPQMSLLASAPTSPSSLCATSCRNKDHEEIDHLVDDKLSFQRSLNFPSFTFMRKDDDEASDGSSRRRRVTLRTRTSCVEEEQRGYHHQESLPLQIYKAKNKWSYNYTDATPPPQKGAVPSNDDSASFLGVSADNDDDDDDKPQSNHNDGRGLEESLRKILKQSNHKSTSRDDDEEELHLSKSSQTMLEQLDSLSKPQQERLLQKIETEQRASQELDPHDTLQILYVDAYICVVNKPSGKYHSLSVV